MRSNLTDRIEALESAAATSLPLDLRDASPDQIERMLLESIRELEQLDPDAQLPGFPERRTVAEGLAILREALNDEELPHETV